MNSDWWEWEHDPASPCAEPSGDACDSLHRWREDIELVAQLGLGAYRFSLEWSRIEPAEGEWSRAALEHYRRICAACRGRGIQPVVTFHHFTLPRWLAAQGGWEAPHAPERFARYVQVAVRHLGDLVAVACTVNEPNVVALMGYVLGAFPPGVSGDLGRYRTASDALVAAHRLAATELRAGPGDFPIGLTLSMAELVAVDGGETARAEAEELLENHFLDALEGDDFVGVQCYTRLRFGPEGLVGGEEGVPKTQMGYEMRPEALAHTIRRAASRTGLPVLVTESGVAVADDRQRIAFVARALEGVGDCLAEGIDVRGYFVWSLLDNFEWTFGYRPTFGLCSVDRVTFERRPKPSALWFATVARTASAPAP